MKEVSEVSLPLREGRLRRGTVGTWGAIAEEIAAMAPACDTVAFMTSAAAFAFVLTPLSFLIATLTMFLEVNTLYHLSRRHASAGGYYGYISTAELNATRASINPPASPV